MTKIKDWQAKRAGPIKIVGVDLIQAGAKGKPPVATDRHGETFELV